MGYDGVKTALAASQGREGRPPFVDTGANLITKANMDGESSSAAQSEGEVSPSAGPLARDSTRHRTLSRTLAA